MCVCIFLICSIELLYEIGIVAWLMSECLLCVYCCLKCFTWINLFLPYYRPLEQICLLSPFWKWEDRGVESTVPQGPIAGTWKNQGSNPGSLYSELEFELLCCGSFLTFPTPLVRGRCTEQWDEIQPWNQKMGFQPRLSHPLSTLFQAAPFISLSFILPVSMRTRTHSPLTPSQWSLDWGAWAQGMYHKNPWHAGRQC